MQDAQPRPLQILNASAGSGKTFNLVLNYIRLLLTDEKKSDKFASIVAMTFTNKAANEMKERIISALDQLSRPDKSERDRAYLALTAQQLQLKEDAVSSRAREVLSSILHRYEDFNVLTIDKFNLRLIRSFSRDLDLPADFEIVLDDDEMLERTVDSLISSIGTSGQEQLTKLMLEYSLRNFEEGEKWDFRSALIDFARLIKYEKYDELIARINDYEFSKEQFDKYRVLLNRIDSEYATRLIRVREFAERNIGDFQTLKNGRNLGNALQKLYDGPPMPDQLFTPAVLKYVHNDSYDAEFARLILSLNEYHEKHLAEATAYRMFLKEFYNMALLQFLSRALQETRKNEQLIRISEFNRLISELVQHEEAPFIYERIGTRFQHFMLDEFQDTSRLQFLNLVPLIHESLSNEHDNLIVGDPKQSIYRFKNGIAEQFVALPSIYNPEGHPRIGQLSGYFEAMGRVDQLQDNWRSGSAIVHFNNAVFAAFRQFIPEGFTDFYNSTEQHPRASFEGYLRLESETDRSVKSERQERETDWLLKIVEECLTDHYQPGDICILGATRRECSSWAQFLTEQAAGRFSVVSADSMFVGNDKLVRLCVSYFRRRLNPANETEQKKFAELFFSLDRAFDYTEYRSCFRKTEAGKSSYFDDSYFIRHYFGSETAFYASYENLYDLLQQFLRLLGTSEISSPHLHHFADLVHEYDIQKGSDLAAFIDYFERSGERSGVQLPESEHAIKVMTIHKSKGLEFPVVILPDVDPDMQVRDKLLLEQEDLILYGSMKREHAVNGFREGYDQETSQIYMDKLNQLYVAFTRPRERLYVLNLFKGKGIGSDLHALLPQSGYQTEQAGERIVCEAGIREARESRVDTVTENRFYPTDISDKLWFPHISLRAADELDEVSSLSEQQRFGNQFHLLLHELHSKTQLEETVGRLVLDGSIEVQFKDELIAQALQVLENPDYIALFEGAEQILSEQSLIIDPQTLRRPDKIILKEAETVLLDYKTGLTDAKHQKQMQAYRHALRSMGYPEVRAFLYYTGLHRLEEV